MWSGTLACDIPAQRWPRRKFQPTTRTAPANCSAWSCSWAPTSDRWLHFCGAIAIHLRLPPAANSATATLIRPTPMATAHQSSRLFGPVNGPTVDRDPAVAVTTSVMAACARKPEGHASIGERQVTKQSRLHIKYLYAYTLADAAFSWRCASARQPSLFLQKSSVANRPGAGPRSSMPTSIDPVAASRPLRPRNSRTWSGRRRTR